MREIRKELDRLRRDANRHRGNLRALRRLSARMHGREVSHSSSPSDDAERIEIECGVVPDNPRTMQLFIDDEVRILEEKKPGSPS